MKKVVKNTAMSESVATTHTDFLEERNHASEQHESLPQSGSNVALIRHIKLEKVDNDEEELMTSKEDAAAEGKAALLYSIKQEEIKQEVIKQESYDVQPDHVTSWYQDMEEGQSCLSTDPSVTDEDHQGPTEYNNYFGQNNEDYNTTKSDEDAAIEGDVTGSQEAAAAVGYATNPGNLQNAQNMMNKYVVSCNADDATSITHVPLGMQGIYTRRLAAIKNKQGKKMRFYCSFCDMGFMYKSILMVHIKTHTGERPFPCTHCDKRFTCNSHLTQHLRTHTGEKPFSCPYCGKAFSMRKDMLVHIRSHTGEKPFSCSFCDKSFSTHSHAARHARIHTGVKPFSCFYCDKEFGRKCDLKRHLVTHSDDRPFICPLCNKSFSRKSCVTRHLHIHNAEKTFSCALCKEAFSRKSNLQRHMRIHVVKDADTESSLNRDVHM